MYGTSLRGTAGAALLSFRHPPPRGLAGAVALFTSLLAATTFSPVAAARDLDLAPDAVFVQGGAGDLDVDQFVVGVTWDWHWPARKLGSDRVHAYWEASIGRWSAEQGQEAMWFTQVGITPALRYEFTPAEQRSWFVDGGIGFNVILPLFRADTRRFSTEFNFGDHVAVGWRNDRGLVNEVSLRFQHFSNGSIDTPNPGQNFLQLRFAKSFGD